MSTSASLWKRLDTFLFPPRVPKSKLLPILFILICEGMVTASLNSYLAFLVYDFGVVDDLSKSGNRTGYFSLSFFIAQFFSSLFFGKLSDIIGRRIPLLIGCAGNLVTTLMFGFSRNFYFALFCRSLCGLMNGTIGVAKAYLGEITDSSNRVQTFSFFGLCFGIGVILGGLLGGVTARPAIQYPTMFDKNGIWGYFPYLLANLTIGVFLLTCLCVAVIFITENVKKPANASEHEIGMKPIENSEDKEDIQDSQHEDVKINNEVHNDGDIATTNSINIEEEEEEPVIYDSNKSKWLYSHCTCLLGNTIFAKTYRWWVKWRFPLYVAIHYGSVGGFVAVSIDQLLPVWMAAPIEKGGLDFSSSAIGVITSVSAVAIIFTQIFIFKKINGYFGILTAFKVAGICIIPFLFCVPFANWILTHIGVGLVWVFLCFLVMAQQVFRQTMMGDAVLFVSNCVTVTDIGTANGYGQAFSALLRGAGTFSILPIFAWSTENKYFPFDYHFAFVLISAYNIVVVIMSLIYDKSINKPKEK